MKTYTSQWRKLARLGFKTCLSAHLKLDPDSESDGKSGKKLEIMEAFIHSKYIKAYEFMAKKLTITSVEDKAYIDFSKYGPLNYKKFKK